MDDCDERERSLSSSTALPLSLLGWYGADLSLRRSRCSCFFSRFVVAMMIDENRVQPHVMVAALILWTETQSIVRNGECNCADVLSIFQKSLDA